MIQIDLHSQTMTCTSCKDETPIQRRLLGRPLEFVEAREAYEQQHKDCASFDSARQARNNRIFNNEAARLLMAQVKKSLQEATA